MQQYVDVSEFIQNSSVLRFSNGYYYHDDLFAFIYPTGSNVKVTYHGNPQNLGTESIESVNEWLEDIIDENIKINKIGIVSGTLVIVTEGGNVHFGRFRMNGQIDNNYINQTFSSVLSANGGIYTFDYNKENPESAIFIGMDRMPIFHNVPAPTALDGVMADNHVEEVALSADNSFCFRFTDNTLYFYNGDSAGNSSYNVIPGDIISFANYDIANFENSPLTDPNAIGKVLSVKANDGFAVITESRRVIVWGGEFQSINENNPNMVKPSILPDVEEIEIGKSFGVMRTTTGVVSAWGDNRNNRVTQIRNISDPVSTILTSDEVAIMGFGRGGQMEAYPSSQISNDTLTISVGGAITPYSLDKLAYAKKISTLNNSDFAVVFVEQVTERFDPVRAVFRMVRNNGKYYIPLSEYFDFDLVGVRLEVYNNTRSSDSTLGRNIRFAINEAYTSVSGNSDMSKVVVSPLDANRNGVPDDPFAFKYIVGDDDFIILETFIDTDTTESTRISRDVAMLSTTNYLLPGQVYYADEGKSITDIFENDNVYTPGEFYRGVVSSDSIVENRAELLPSGFDEVTGKRYTRVNGRGYSSTEPFMFTWSHFSSDGGYVIDPSMSNIMDMYILTDSYNTAVRRWLKTDGDVRNMPVPPTTEELRTMVSSIEENKSTSDQIIYIPAKFRLLFGQSAEPEHQAWFNIVKTPSSSMSDNEVKTRVITAINEYFEIDNWDFGESFYFTELAGYIHNKLIGDVASVVVVPRFRTASFGDLFQIKSGANELFLSTATVEDVVINNHYTDQNLRRI